MKHVLCGLLAFTLLAGLLAGCRGQLTEPDFPATHTPGPEMITSPCDLDVTPPVALSSSAECNQCRFHLLPGAPEPSPHTIYTIHSDLPEIMMTPGVLYSTSPVLPPFALKDGTDLPMDRRVQVNAGFQTIDNSFEVFMFHISQPGDGSQPRRVVVYTENQGTEPVTIQPRQVLITDGIIAAVHEMENTLGRRVMEEDWDRPIGAVTIAPGTGNVVAYSKQFAAPRNDADSSANINCFGIVRADVMPEGPEAADLKVSIVGIPADSDIGKLRELTEAHLNTGAQSGEGYLNFMNDPQGCALSRTCGVFPSFVWRSEQMTIDVASLPEPRTRFQMALPEIQSHGCPEARQTVDLMLSQKYNRPDTVGNYMIDYRVAFHLVNQGDTPKRVDLRFGKVDADIGLGWQIARGERPVSDREVDATAVHVGWAGPKQDDLTRSMLEPAGGPIVLEPCEEVYVAARFMILGNSSLPFQLELVRGQGGSAD